MGVARAAHRNLRICSRGGRLPGLPSGFRSGPARERGGSGGGRSLERAGALGRIRGRRSQRGIWRGAGSIDDRLPDRRRCIRPRRDRRPPVPCPAARPPHVRAGRRLDATGRLGFAGRDPHRRRDLSRRLGVVGAGLRERAACRCDGRERDSPGWQSAGARGCVSGRDRQHVAARAPSAAARRCSGSGRATRRCTLRRRYAGPRFLLAGDAGSFIDPLSSFGVKKALASAWLGAIVVHTRLAHADRETLASDFFSDWERRRLCDAPEAVARLRARGLRRTRIRVLDARARTWRSTRQQTPMTSMWRTTRMCSAPSRPSRPRRASI